MRKPKFPLLILLTLLFAAYGLGFYSGRSPSPSHITVELSSQVTQMPPETLPPDLTLPQAPEITFPIDINRATRRELMALPGIGDVLAERILDYRAFHGRFTAPEQLLQVEGIGKTRLEEILDLIVIGG